MQFGEYVWYTSQKRWTFYSWNDLNWFKKCGRKKSMYIIFLFIWEFDCENVGSLGNVMNSSICVLNKLNSLQLKCLESVKKCRRRSYVKGRLMWKWGNIWKCERSIHVLNNHLFNQTNAICQALFVRKNATQSLSQKSLPLPTAKAHKKANMCWQTCARKHARDKRGKERWPKDLRPINSLRMKWLKNAIRLNEDAECLMEAFSEQQRSSTQKKGCWHRRKMVLWKMNGVKRE